MAAPVPVDYDPFAEVVKPEPVDYDPFATTPEPVDYDPFAPPVSEVQPARLPFDGMQSRIDESRAADKTLLSATARPKPKPIRQDEAIAAADRIGWDDERLAALINPSKPDAVTGADILAKKEADYALASTYIGNEEKLRGLAFKPGSAPKLPEAPSDATVVAVAKPGAVKEIPKPKLAPNSLAAALPAKDATDTQGTAPERDPAQPVAPEAQLYERAQTLAEAMQSGGHGFVKGVTAGTVDAPEGGGIPGAVGQVAGSLVGGVGASLAGPAGPPAFLMVQFLNDLQDRGMDPARMTDHEILALAATSGLFGGLTPVAFGVGAVKRALTGAALQGAQALGEEEIIAAVTDTAPERLKALILGGAFGAGFGAAFKHSPKVREAVSGKLAPEEVKVLDEAVGAETPAAPRAEVPELEAKIGEQVPEQAAKVPEQAAPVEAAPKPAEPVAPTDAAAPPTSEPAVTPEAAKVLDDLEASGVGVPGFVTKNLKKIAEENGIEVKPETTPNEIIEGLKGKRSAEPVEAVSPVEAVAPEAATEAAAPVKPATPPDPTITDRVPFGTTPDGIVRAPEVHEHNTSARKAYTTADRASMGLDEIPSPERKSWQDALDKARDEGYEDRAQFLAKEVIAGNHKVLDDVETAGMVRRMVSLKNQHEAAMDNLAKTTDQAAINSQARAISEIEEQFDEISRAVRYSGTEKGRNLAAQKLTLNRGYELVDIKTRAKAKKGKPLTAEEEAKFKDLADKLKIADKALTDANARIKELQASDAVRENRRSARATKKHPKETKATIADLTEKTRRLLAASCLTS